MSKDNIKMTISFRGESFDTDLKTIEQANKDLKSGKIDFISDCHNTEYKIINGKFICLQCGETCKPMPIRRAP